MKSAKPTKAKAKKATVKKVTVKKAAAQRAHNPEWADNTRTERNARKLSIDNEWAGKVSGGKYPTLRRLMTAIHRGDIILSAS